MGLAPTEIPTQSRGVMSFHQLFHLLRHALVHRVGLARRKAALPPPLPEHNVNFMLGLLIATILILITTVLCVAVNKRLHHATATKATLRVQSLYRASTKRQAFFKQRSAVVLLQSSLRTFFKQRSAAVVLQAHVRGAAARAWFAPAAKSISLLKNIKWTPRRASVASKVLTMARPKAAEPGSSTSGSASPPGASAPSPETGLWLSRIEQSVGRVENLLKSQGTNKSAVPRAPPPPPPLPPSEQLHPPPLKASNSQSFAHSDAHSALLLQLKEHLSARRSSLDICEDDPLTLEETPSTAAVM